MISVPSSSGLQVLNTPGYTALPSSLSTGTAVPSNASANTYSDWVEFRSASGNKILILGLVLRSVTVAFNHCVVDIGTGTAGAEVVLSAQRVPTITTTTETVVLFPVPLVVAASTRIAVRNAKDSAGSYDLQVRLIVAETADLEAVSA